jgi:SAM-dependent methyltransferase
MGNNFFVRHRKYWESFYESFNILVPTTFAKFIYNFLLKKNTNNIKLVDLGCGNGRDTFYFHSKGIFCTGLDWFAPEVKKQKNLKFKRVDIVAYNFNDLKNVDIFYTRFYLHSITEKNEKVVNKKVFNNLVEGGYYCIEVREISDKSFDIKQKIGRDEFFTDHYRRLFNLNSFIKRLEDIGFDIVYKFSGKNVCIFKNSNPKVLRVIAMKKEKK